LLHLFSYTIAFVAFFAVLSAFFVNLLYLP